ncbi:MAG: hypothetical protein M1827_004265 [Pycnora praestabilis]|nr:MAG: hypothetical protein M1827_004265 [Pycnora praestabilis]
MQTNIFLTAAALLATSALVAADSSSASPITSVSPKQSSEILSDLSTYLTHVAAQPAATTVAEEIATSVPTSVLAAIEEGDFSITGTATPTWFTALPTDAQNWVLSVASAEVAIVTKDVQGAGAMPTGAVKVAGVAVAGVLGVAAML